MTAIKMASLWVLAFGGFPCLQLWLKVESDARTRGTCRPSPVSERWSTCRQFEWPSTADREVLVPVELPDPVAGTCEVVIRAEAIDTIYLETQIRGGWGEAFGIEPPYVPGGAAAGTVVSVGLDVDPSWVGRRALARVGTSGTYAKFVRTSIDRLVPIPEGLGMLEGRPGPRRCDRDGHHGGADHSSRVNGFSSSGQQSAWGRFWSSLPMRRLLGSSGPHAGRRSWIEQARDVFGGLPVDVLLGGVGALSSEAFELVSHGGRVSAQGAASGVLAELDQTAVDERGIVVRGIAQLQFEAAEMVRRATKAVAEAARGRLRPVIGREFTLSDAADAHHAIEARAVPGKALLIP